METGETLRTRLSKNFSHSYWNEHEQ